LLGQCKIIFDLKWPCWTTNNHLSIKNPHSIKLKNIIFFGHPNFKRFREITFTQMISHKRPWFDLSLIWPQDSFIQISQKIELTYRGISRLNSVDSHQSVHSIHGAINYDLWWPQMTSSSVTCFISSETAPSNGPSRHPYYGSLNHSTLFDLWWPQITSSSCTHKIIS